VQEEGFGTMDSISIASSGSKVAAAAARTADGHGAPTKAAVPAETLGGDSVAISTAASAATRKKSKRKRSLLEKEWKELSVGEKALAPFAVLGLVLYDPVYRTARALATLTKPVSR